MLHDVWQHEDLLASVCARAEDQPTAERLLGTCRTLHAAAADDAFFRLVAELQWGRRFWRDALRRPTLRSTFRSMREELRRIHRFQVMLRRHGLKPWREPDFRRWWGAEARHVLWHRS